MAYSEKIDARGGECFVENQKVECPKNTKAVTFQGETLDLLPRIPLLERRGDLLFSALLGITVLTFISLAVFKTKIFGKTLVEYLKPLWYFIIVCLLTVAWQYLFGLKIANPSLPLRISQWIWEAAVLASAYKLSKLPGFSYGNMFFLGVIYSFLIHGLKVSIRYFFYGKTLLYCLDRFIYGSLLVMFFAFFLGSVIVWSNRRRSNL